MESTGASSIDKQIVDLVTSVRNDRDNFLELLLQRVRYQHGLSDEEFAKDWVLEEYPVEMISERMSFDAHDPDKQYVFRITQNFRIRLKTDEERQLETQYKEKKDVDPNHL